LKWKVIKRAEVQVVMPSDVAEVHPAYEGAGVRPAEVHAKEAVAVAVEVVDIVAAEALGTVAGVDGTLGEVECFG
jgi:hypothetical protein